MLCRPLSIWRECYETVSPRQQKGSRDRFGDHEDSAEHLTSDDQSLGKIYTLGHYSKTYIDAIDTLHSTPP